MTSHAIALLTVTLVGLAVPDVGWTAPPSVGLRSMFESAKNGARCVVDGDSRASVVLKPSEEVRVHIQVPSSGVLSLALATTDGSPPPPWLLAIETPDGTPLLTDTSSPVHHWSERALDLANLAGRSVVVRARTGAPTALFTSDVCLAGASGVHADFALHDGDRVVFLGDSNTGAAGFVQTVEVYTLLRFPARRVRFINSGIGGDTAVGGLARLDRDVFQHHATVLVIMYGINDVCWGACGGEPQRDAHVDAIGAIVERARARGIRVYVCSYPTSGVESQAYLDTVLEDIGDRAMERSQDLGGDAIDVRRYLREIQRGTDQVESQADPSAVKVSTHNNDKIHLNEVGQAAVALAILKGLGAPQVVSQVVIDAGAQVDRGACSLPTPLRPAIPLIWQEVAWKSRVCSEESPGCGPAVVLADGARVQQLQGDAEIVAFDRTDDGWPFLPEVGTMIQGLVPFAQEIGRYELSVRSLRAGRYAVEVDGRELQMSGILSADLLATGINLDFLRAPGLEPGSPWEMRAIALLRLVQAQHWVRVDGAQLDAYGGLEAPSRRRARETQSERIDARLRRLARSIASPSPHHFVVRRVGD